MPDAITVAMQTGNRIGYHPETAAVELEGFAGLYSAAVSAAETLPANPKPNTANRSGIAGGLSDTEREALHLRHIKLTLAALAATP